MTPSQLNNKTIFLDDLKNLELTVFDNSNSTVILKCGNDVIFSMEPYAIVDPNSFSVVSVDLYDVMLDYLTLRWPERFERPQSGTWTMTSESPEFTLIKYIGDAYQTFLFRVAPFDSSEALTGGALSDLECVRIPKDYVYPVNAMLPPVIIDSTREDAPSPFPETVELFIETSFESGTTTDLVDSDSGEQTAFEVGDTVTVLEMQSRLIAFSGATLPSAPFRIKVEFSTSFTDRVVVSPLFTFAQGDFEQYMFRNRYGNFDNFPLQGVLKDVSEVSIENASLSSGRVRVRASMDERFHQSSGHLSVREASVLKGLLTSSHAYHLDKTSGTWRRIVIESVSVSRNARRAPEAGISFEWSYADNE